ncbi:hypothetical protein BJY00DRAFT_297516 [Aspergillus carlsbadensis]|nr:hypothetical protein BJY00DRAFT_297516 [Aspergillus carlsbadensis]
MNQLAIKPRPNPPLRQPQKEAKARMGPENDLAAGDDCRPSTDDPSQGMPPDARLLCADTCRGCDWTHVSPKSSRVDQGQLLPLTDVQQAVDNHHRNLTFWTPSLHINMATLRLLKQTLREKATEIPPSSRHSLSDTEYRNAFDIVRTGSRETYHEFIVPQLSELLAKFDNPISLLEIGPGPKSILGCLPEQQRRGIKRYTAYEPNGLFAARLEEWLGRTLEGQGCGVPLPGLEDESKIHRARFPPRNAGDRVGVDETFDVILFCHSLYGMDPKHAALRTSLGLLTEDGVVVVFHRDHTLRLEGLLSHQLASLPTATVNVPDDDATLDSFTSFIAGFVVQDTETQKALQLEWRAICRDLGHRDDFGYLVFHSPQTMMTFTKTADTLPKLAAQVPLTSEHREVKNRQARLHRPAAVVKPTEIKHIQQCVQWAIEQGVGLTVIGGGHGGHCLQPGAVAIDMSAFNEVRVCAEADNISESELNSTGFPCVVAGGGCTTGDIIHNAMGADLTVPLGSRPSVGAGLWLQGGIGHLARLHGLACDSIIGAVMVSIKTGKILVLGSVPDEHCPVDAVRPENEHDLLWALKGAGTNIGIIISVTFKAFPAPSYRVRNWTMPLKTSRGAQNAFRCLGSLASKLPRHFSVDGYLYWDSGRVHLGVTLFEVLGNTSNREPLPPTAVGLIDDLGPPKSTQTVDSVGLFDCEMYMSAMHGGHGGGKTSAFKRCVFLKNVGEKAISDSLVAAIENRPSPLCYLHLLHGGGAVSDTTSDASAFSPRDWDYACVVTGVWPRDQDEMDVSFRAVQWVYNAVKDLLPMSSGVYSADLGPDPRDASLAAKAFGANGPRLASVKRSCDPHGVLAYACPVPNPPTTVILVTGQSGSGKDYCTSIWASYLAVSANKPLKARVASISDATKREYARATGADLDRLLRDRAYKEQHRPALTAFFKDQVQARPRLPEEHFLELAGCSMGADVLFITGMRDEAPVACFSRLIPDVRVIEVYVTVREEMRRVRRGESETSNAISNPPTLDYCPDFIFSNEASGSGAAESFAKYSLLPLFHGDFQKLASMVPLVTDFPRLGVDFRHVLNIAQQPGGLDLCTSLLQTHFTGDWFQVNAIACCQSGGFIFAPALSVRVNVPLVLIREEEKLPPPTISVRKPSSHISSISDNADTATKILQMEEGILPGDARVVVVDDVLATGHTLCAVIQLLTQAGVSAERIHVMVVAEFPAHGGRAFLRAQGFGRVRIQSLLVFGGL